jgi:hypothetical protein
MKVTPYGIDTCCLCDDPAVGLWREDPDGELLPYCDADNPKTDTTVIRDSHGGEMRNPSFGLGEWFPIANRRNGYGEIQ